MSEHGETGNEKIEMIEDTSAITVVENNMEYKIVRADGEAATFDVEVANVAEIEVVEKGDTGCNKCIVKKEKKSKEKGYIGETPHSGLRLRRGQGFEEDQGKYEDYPLKSVLPADKRKAGMKESFGDRAFPVMNECLKKLPKEFQQGLFDMMPEKITGTKGGFQQVC